MDRLRAIGHGVVEGIYVRTCSECGRRGEWVCRFCLPKVVPHGIPICLRCGVHVVGDCECSALPDEIEQIRSVFPYAGWVRSSIHLFKYESQFARAGALAQHMLPLFSSLAQPDLIVAVPMHKRREQRRGFNQAHLLAQELSRCTTIPLGQVLERTDDRGPQVGRHRHERWLAAQSAYQCTEPGQVTGKSIVLIDDVITTGATVSHCAIELVRAGAASVKALSLARD